MEGRTKEDRTTEGKKHSRRAGFVMLFIPVGPLAAQTGAVEIFEARCRCQAEPKEHHCLASALAVSMAGVDAHDAALAASRALWTLGTRDKGPSSRAGCHNAVKQRSQQ